MTPYIWHWLVEFAFGSFNRCTICGIGVVRYSVLKGSDVYVSVAGFWGTGVLSFGLVICVGQIQFRVAMR